MPGNFLLVCFVFSEISMENDAILSTCKKFTWWTWLYTQLNKSKYQILLHLLDGKRPVWPLNLVGKRHVLRVNKNYYQLHPSLKNGKLSAKFLFSNVNGFIPFHVTFDQWKVYSWITKLLMFWETMFCSDMLSMFLIFDHPLWWMSVNKFGRNYHPGVTSDQNVKCLIHWAKVSHNQTKLLCLKSKNMHVTTIFRNMRTLPKSMPK